MHILPKDRGILCSLAIAIVLLVMLAAPASAVPPVEPPLSGSGATNHTDILCEGSVRVTSSYSVSYTVGGDLSTTPPTYGGASAQLRYSDDLRAFDGTTRLVKDYSSDITSTEDDNVVVFKDFGYVRDPDSIGILTSEEKIGIGIATTEDHGVGGLGGSCIWGGALPPGCVYVAAGSYLQVTEVEAHTEARAATTSSPRLSYSIIAVGKGTISAGMEVRALEGLEGGALGATESFSDHASASGEWKFTKTMSYNAAARLPIVMPEPWYLVP